VECVKKLDHSGRVVGEQFQIHVPFWRTWPRDMQTRAIPLAMFLKLLEHGLTHYRLNRSAQGIDGPHRKQFCRGFQAAVALMTRCGIEQSFASFLGKFTRSVFNKPSGGINPRMRVFALCQIPERLEAHIAQTRLRAT